MIDGNNMADQLGSDKNSFLFSIQQDSQDKNRYFLTLGTSQATNQSLGLVVRCLKKQSQPAGYELKVADQVKIGRVRFIVREVKDADGNVNKLQSAQKIDYIKNDQMEIEKDFANPLNCRICLMDDTYSDPIENTLISPCKCRGSCQYVHMKCLKQWIDSKKSRVENSGSICLYFNYKKLSCEICKENLPYAIKLDDQEHEIVEIKKPQDTPYLLLEKIESAKENRGLFLIKASNLEAKIGRGHINNILVSDISVSRNHAFISYKDGKFMLFDNYSKFGTLVEVNQPIEISPEKTMIQCGKTVIIFSLKKENMTAKPTVTEPMEILNSPGTPSTINEAEEKQTQDCEVSTRKRGRGRKLRREDSSTQMIPDNVPYIEILDDSQIIESKLLKQSKKIFKITKPDTQIIRQIALNKNEEKRTRGRKPK